MRRFKKTWEGPRHPWRKDVLLAEIDLLGRYGLKNKRELWKMKTILRKIRKRARALLALSPAERAIEEEKLKKLLIKYGLIDENADVSAILSLTIEDILKRRLQTVIYNLKLANSIYHARQLIVHKKVMVGDKIVSSPSYLVKKDEEDKIKII